MNLTPAEVDLLVADFEFFQILERNLRIARKMAMAVSPTITEDEILQIYWESVLPESGRETWSKWERNGTATPEEREIVRRELNDY